MAREIISSFEDFEEKFPKIISFGESHPRITALKTYFSKGGVISAVSRGSGWPKIIYPSPLKLKKSLEELNQSLALLEGKKKAWEKTFFEAKIYNMKNKVLKFLDPLYWQHVSKTLYDKDYRDDAEKVSLPVQMVKEPRYRPMINMFVHDIEYRKQLTETVENSVVYKKDKRVAKYAQELRDFRMDTSNKNIEFLQKKINALKNEISVLKTLLRWIEEKKHSVLK